jgi:aminopeptidase N
VAASAGAAGVGDPYFPDLGNGGYDVTHYDLNLTLDPAKNLLDAIATIRANATQALSRFNLDLLGLKLQTLKVNGVDAPFARDGRELVITPAKPIASGDAFTVTVLYVGSPEPRSTKALPIAVGWIATGDSTYVFNEPEGASTWYPVNDHPIDKASYTFHITVPDGVTAVANGDLVSQRPTGDGHTTWTYEETAPMASYLAQVAVGDFRIVTSDGPNGVKIRNAFAAQLADQAAVDFSRTADMLQLFTTDFGPYPFDVYGALVVNELNGYALEAQTLSLFDVSSVNGSVADDTVVAHELAHQWFGDSVTPASWKDIWLAEGFATYGEWLWQEHVDGTPVAASAKQSHDQLRGQPDSTRPGDPGVEHLFDVGAVYGRGALTLQALRVTVGEAPFFTILRTYASRFAGRNATTADFIAVVNEVAGRDLHDLFDAWLYREALPDLPS